MTLEGRRKRESLIALFVSTLAAAFGLFCLIFILSDVLIHGIGALKVSLFLNDPTPAGVTGGGLRNAFFGQFLITFFATLIGVPIGVLGGRDGAANFQDILSSSTFECRAPRDFKIAPAVTLGCFSIAFSDV